MKNDLFSDYFLNEYTPLNPRHSRDDLLNEFMDKARSLNLDDAESDLLLEAFTHKSFAHESKVELGNNERLEFLGDSVLQLVVSENLMLLHPSASEGKLSKLRSSIVNEASLSRLAKRLRLDRLMLLGKGELRERGHEKESLLANCFESYLGAVYLSRGYAGARERILEVFAQEAAAGNDLFDLEAINAFDAKSRLQETLMKKRGEAPRYVCEEVDEGKEKLFEIALTVKGETLGKLRHRSKKKGMQLLAKQILNEMNKTETIK